MWKSWRDPIKFCMKHPRIKYFYNKTLPAALIISRRETAFIVYCLRSHLQENDSSLVWLTDPEKPAWNLYFLISRFLLEFDVFNPYWDNVPFLDPLEISENLTVFLCFQDA